MSHSLEKCDLRANIHAQLFIQMQCAACSDPGCGVILTSTNMIISNVGFPSPTEAGLVRGIQLEASRESNVTFNMLT